MKLHKVFLLVSLALVGMVATACSDDDYQVGPQVTGVGLSFGGEQVQFINVKSADAAEFPLIVMRKDSTSAADVNLIVENDTTADGKVVFNIPQTVHFNAGQGTVIVSVDFSNAEIGEEYNIVVSVPKGQENFYKNNIIMRTVLRDYSWVKYNCHIAEDFLGVDADAIVEHAQGFNVWRLLNPYETADVDSLNVTESIKFWITEDGSIRFNKFKSNINDDATQIWAMMPSEADPQDAETDLKSKLEDETTAIICPNYYIPTSNTSYGTEYPITIKLTSPDVTFKQK